MSDNSLGWKCAQYEMKGVPLRLEIGPRDIENGEFMAVRRDNREKTSVKIEEAVERVNQLLGDVQNGMYAKAKKNLDDHTYVAHSLE
ncbi:prolyl-tRNA synthetase, partial [gut metagenome]